MVSIVYRNVLSYNLYFFLVLLLVLFFVTVSGSHSFSTSGFGAVWVVDGEVSDCACATAASISSWLTCSPARIRAAISGVTAIRLTLVSGEDKNQIRHSRVVTMRSKTGVKSRLTKARCAFSDPGLRVILLIKTLAASIGGHSSKEPCRNCTDYNNRCEYPVQDTKSGVSLDEPKRGHTHIIQSSSAILWRYAIRNSCEGPINGKVTFAVSQFPHLDNPVERCHR